MYSRFFKAKLPKDFSENVFIAIAGAVPVPVISALLYGANQYAENYFEKKGREIERERDLLAQGFKKVPVEPRDNKSTFRYARPSFGLFAMMLLESRNRTEYTWRNEKGEEPSKIEGLKK